MTPRICPVRLQIRDLRLGGGLSGNPLESDEQEYLSLNNSLFSSFSLSVTLNFSPPLRNKLSKAINGEGDTEMYKDINALCGFK